MTVHRTIGGLRKALVSQADIGLVPTMGAFHEGHLELMRRCAKTCSTTVVSIFVNPSQFGPNEDFGAYPRQEARDLELAGSTDIQHVFIPSVDEMYAENRTTVHVQEVSEKWEGASRPGHFDGVATVVLKLFNIVQPGRAFFGLKDLQQCAVVRSMVTSLNVPLDLEFVETVREPSGLAMSSRNAYLSSERRTLASHLYKSLCEARSRLNSGQDPDRVVADCKSKLIDLGFEVDYVAMVNPITMEAIRVPEPNSRLMAAVKLAETRLIDNILIAEQ